MSQLALYLNLKKGKKQRHEYYIVSEYKYIRNSFNINQGKIMSKQKRIMIDGMNLSLDKGTGVATYAKNLSYCLHDMNYAVDVLYGSRAAPGYSDLMKEIAFFDNNAGDIPSWLKVLRAVKESLYAPFGFSATKVPLNDIVVKDTFKSKLPYYDDIYNAPDVFRKASVTFSIFEKLHKVHIPKKPDIMHWTYPIALKVKSIPNIYTLHDLVPLRLPYTTLDNKRRYLRLVSIIAERADHIVTVSETSKKDIIDILKIDPNKITNTYQAVSIPDKYKNKPIEIVQQEISGTFNLDYKKYFLFFGSIEPKKNIGRIIEAYLNAKVDTPLVIVGAQAWKSEEELKLLFDDNIRSYVIENNEIKVKKKVIQFSYAPFPLLVSLIRGAKATIFPSLYEGFGLPALESMLLGTPVITSNTASLPEVVGEAALSVDPYNTFELTKAIRQMDQDEDLRNELVTRGKIRAELFNEQNYMNRLNSVYNKFL